MMLAQKRLIHRAGQNNELYCMTILLNLFASNLMPTGENAKVVYV